MIKYLIQISYSKRKKRESWALKRSTWPCPKHGEYIQTSMKISIWKQRIILFTAFLKKNPETLLDGKKTVSAIAVGGEWRGKISTESETAGLNNQFVEGVLVPVTAPGSSTKEQRTPQEPANADVGNGRSLPILTPQFWGTQGGEVLGRGRV